MTRRRAVLHPIRERPLVVTVVASILLVSSLALVFGGPIATAASWYEVLEDQRQGFTKQADIPLGIFVAVSVGLVMIGAGVLLGWVGRATARGVLWAWDAVAAGAIVLMVLLGGFLFFMGLAAMGVEPWAPYALLVALVLISALATVSWLYRRNAVRVFFGKPTSPASVRHVM